MGTVLEREAVVAVNRPLTDRLWMLELEVADIGAALKPGQFVHARIPRMEGHILRRPFSIYQVDRIWGSVTILYQVVGFGSRHMTTLQPDETLSLMGPIGNGWSAPEDAKRVLLVAGGVGAAPLYLYAEELVKRGVEVEVVLGAQNADALVCEPVYTDLLGHEPHLATDDGSRGHAGFCTEVAAKLIGESHFDQVACCGPEPVMRIVSGLAADAGIPAQISLEKRMACGIGACLSCIVETTQGRKRSCVDGPVFDAAEVVWQ